MANWDSRFVSLSEHIANWSQDSTQVGCVTVGPDHEILTTGYNGLPRGVEPSPSVRTRRPHKYQWTEHAERNAIYNAARDGIRLLGSTCYTNWFPCTDCARALIQCGVTRVVGREPSYDHAKYGSDFVVSKQMMEEAGIKIVYIEKEG